MLNYTSKNIKFTKSMKDYLEGKLGKLSKYLEEDINGQCSLKKEGINFKLEVSLNINGSHLRTSKVGEDYYALVIQVVDQMERQISKFSAVRNTKETRNGFKNLPILDGEIKPLEFSREKVLIIDDISPEEAVEQMELLGHSFYVFKDIDTQEMCVVYKRTDESYGLLLLK